MIEAIPNIIGLIGVGLIVLAYFLLQTSRLHAHHLAYPLLNLVGALMHLYSLLYFWNWASVVIEIFWIAISLYGVWGAVKTRNI